MINVDSGADHTKTHVPSFPGDPVTGEPKSIDTGLMFYDIREGTGAQPSGANTRVKVQYTGWLTDGTKFDSSVDKGQPIIWPVGKFIRGWVDGLMTMKVGAKRKLIIPYNLAYGEAGEPPRVS